MLVAGELVDLDTMIPHRLANDPVLGGSIADDTAYLWVRTAAGSELRAHDTTSGTLRWSLPVAECSALTASSLGAFCATRSDVRWFRRSDGVSKPVASSSGVTSMIALGGRVLVLRPNRSLDAFEADGTPGGHATVPVMPDHVFAESTISIAGTLGCGAHRDQQATTLFCFDATPKIVWKRAVMVPGGFVRQADKDVIVVSSDHESEIVRTADGSPVLHMSVPASAALTTAGVLDNVVSIDPDVTLWDGRGAKLWSSPQNSHRESVRAVRIGSVIAVAIYSPIATGTQLLGLDAGSGALAWRANVDTLPIGHSEYWNDVALRLRGRSLVLVGHEASQTYVQTFDASGKRIGSVVRGN